MLNAFARTDDYELKQAVPYGPDARARLDIYLPVGLGAGASPVDARGAPVVVFFYGGSWQNGAREQYRFVGAALASRGFIVVVPDYRKYPAVVFPSFVDDAARAVAWVRGHAESWGGDPDRLFLMGHSAGAQIAALLATDGRYLGAYGIQKHQIAGVVGLAGPYDFLPLQDATLRRIFPGPLRARSQPINFTQGGEPRMFLAVGADDTTVDPANTYRFAARLRAAGDAVIVKRYPMMSHALLVGALGAPLRLILPVFDDVTTFLASR
ncbi:alpha/beta hydrolase [Trinickia dabaoshanensis]|nr:alpha/beta hydrolase [Trinickia dabaoshanensis]